MTPVTSLCLLLSLTHQIISVPLDLVIPPSTSTSHPSFPPLPSTTPSTTSEPRDPSEIKFPEITSFHVTSRIQFRYSRTVIESHIRNPDIEAHLADFAVAIPESAFISNFSMVLGNKEFVARVEEKDEAEKTFKKALSNGQGAGLVNQDIRDSSRYIVSANVEPGHKIIFRLTYDELLDRKAGLYEQEINIDLKQIVEDFKVEIHINESLPITTISVPELLQSNEIDFEDKTENTIAVVERKINDDDKIAKIVFAPNREEQEAAREQGESGKLVVRYDVDRQGQDSEVQVIDGYFVHYFTPDHLETLPKHVIFILDTSGSMYGEKIQQLKDSMFTVLQDLKPTDFFNIISFSSDVTHWTRSEADSFVTETGVDAVSATKENTKTAFDYVRDLKATGGTNINSAFLAGLNVSRDVMRKGTLPQGVASMIVFLSDGEASEGETDGDTIQANIAKANSDLQLPIFSVAFGRGADFQLLKDISQATDSYAKRVYEGSDAALQLENFYSQISSPLVTNLKFDYVGELVDNSSVSNTETRTLFRGGQYVVVGKLQEAEDGGLEVQVTGDTRQGRYSDIIQICHRNPIQSTSSQLTVSPNSTLPSRCLPFFPPIPQRSQAQEFMQSLHAFLNIQQLLRKNLKEAALILSLQNNFVTPLTSLVVVRPGENDTLVQGSDNEVPPQIRAYGISAYSSGISPYSSSVNTRRFNAPSLQAAPNVLRSSVSSLRSKSSPPRRPVVTTRTPYTTTFLPRTRTPNTTTFHARTSAPSSCSGSLTLYSSTYHRGEQITLQADSTNLSTFSDLAVSATLQGSCCWQLFADPDFGGESYKLIPGGDYKTTNSFGRNLFQEVSSVRRVLCNV